MSVWTENIIAEFHQKILSGCLKICKIRQGITFFCHTLYIIVAEKQGVRSWTRAIHGSVIHQLAPRGTLLNILIRLIFPETIELDAMGLSSFSFFCSGLQKTFLFCNWVRIGCSRSSKVDDFGVNGKRICNFLLVLHCNYGPVFHRFWHTAINLLKTAYFSYPSLI